MPPVRVDEAPGIRAIAAQRYQRIIELTNGRGIVSVRELCDALGLSDMTIRRDLSVFERQGALRRTHGGAVSLARPTFNIAYDERQRLQMEAKNRIGAAAATLVADGDTRFLGSGTTVLALARHLSGRQRLTVITDLIPVVPELVDEPGITVISTGGIASRVSGSLVGSIAEHTVSQLRVRKASVGTTGVSPEGFSNVSLEEAAIQRKMLASAGETYVLADHTKFAKRSLVLTATFRDVAGVVTDAATPAEELAWVRTACGRVIVAAA
jgi:DeoR/GlpR family transcriptional regulator of sugar metabolism